MSNWAEIQLEGRRARRRVRLQYSDARCARVWRCIVGAAALAFASAPSYAQVGGPYINTTITGYGATSPCASPLIMTINVPDSFAIGDLDVRFVASHNWRSDTNLSVTSPTGTTVGMLTGPYTTNLNNYNVRFDDEAAIVVDTGAHLVNQSVTGPPMSVQSEGGVLSDFDGENAQGLWTFTICDTFPAADNGTVRALELFFTEGARLTATNSVSVYGPESYGVPGTDVLYSVTVTNEGDGPSGVDSILFIDDLPPELEFYNGDVDDGGPETNAVSFTQSAGAGLTFTYASDVAFSNAGAAPASFAACTYSPSPGYDPDVTYVCINPKGAMQTGAPDPTFTVSFRTRIK